MMTDEHECPACDEAYDSRRGLLAHARQKHEDDYEDIKAGAYEDTTETEDEEDVDREETTEMIEVEEPDAVDTETSSSSDGAPVIDMDEYLDDDEDDDGDDGDSGADTPTESTETTPEPQGRKGLAESVNTLYGHALTFDMDEDDPETSETRDKLTQIAEDVTLGENAAWFYEEKIADAGELTPGKALLFSLIMAVVLGAMQRPDLVSTLKERTQEDEDDE